jgi:predicted enzyme related to lactoylglutathione lyase
MLINWITIRVRDLAAAKRFYGGFLNIPLLQEFSPAPTLQIAFFGFEGEAQIELLCDSAQSLPPATPSSVSIGIAPKNYDALLASARKEGLFKGEPAIIGGHMECFFIMDPDGTGIQIIKDIA